MSKILVKQAPTVQQFQDVGGAPSFGQLARRVFAPRNQSGPQKDNTGNYVGTPTRGQRAGAALGLLGKVGALTATGLGTAYGLQGGNMGAALNAPLTYQGLDPTGTTKLGQTELATQQGPMLPANYGQEVSAAQNPSPPRRGTQGTINPTTGEAITVPLPTQTSPPTPGTLGATKQQQNQTQAAQPVQQPQTAATANVGASLNQETSPMYNQPTLPAPAPAQAAPTPAAPVPATPPQYIPPKSQGGSMPRMLGPQTTVPQTTVPQIPSYLPRLGMTPEELRNFHNQNNEDDEIRNAFVSRIFDEFTDVFYKADPHVVGMIIADMYLTR